METSKEQRMMTRDQWMQEARRWAKHAYCYEGMIDEFIDHFDAGYAQGNEPYGTVDAFAEKYGLDRADQDWGINSGVEFRREA